MTGRPPDSASGKKDSAFVEKDNTCAEKGPHLYISFLIFPVYNKTHVKKAV
jgi:hypothetical protein